MTKCNVGSWTGCRNREETLVGKAGGIQGSLKFTVLEQGQLLSFNACSMVVHNVTAPGS